MSEKPIAPTPEQARETIELCNSQQPQPVWVIAENVRFEPVFTTAMETAQLLGTILKGDYTANMGMRSGNPCVCLALTDMFMSYAVLSDLNCRHFAVDSTEARCR
jgi:hypothetical protein